MRKILLLFLALIMVASLKAEDKIKLMKQYNFAMKSQNHLEGFSKSIGKNDFSYHSLRIDVTDALLTRCTDGEMAIEWLTQNVPNNNEKGVWFTWIAASAEWRNGRLEDRMAEIPVELRLSVWSLRSLHVACGISGKSLHRPSA